VKFASAAQDFLSLLQQLGADEVRWRELVDQHGTRPDPRWREQARAHLQGSPRRVAVLPPRLLPVLDAGGKPIDAQAVPVEDLDDQILRDWSAY
jgi:dipeptidyl-peptidase-3